MAGGDGALPTLLQPAMSAGQDEAATMSRDILEILPPEIWQRCIAQACHGDRYMATLLNLTLVSRRWCQLLTGTPTLWANIHVNDADEDSLATIAVFLHLSCDVQLALIISVPLSQRWDIIYPIFLPHRHRIRAITLRVKSKFHSATCGLKTTISDAELQQNLKHVFVTLRFPTSVEYLDVIPNRPVRMESIWVPSNIVSAGNWLVPFRSLEPLSYSASRLHHLSISTTDLVDFFPHLSAFENLKILHLHSDGQEYRHPPPSPIDGVVLPRLNTLRYHGRIYWVSTQLLGAVAQTIQHLELRIGIMDLEEAIHALSVSKSLRHLSLMIEHDPSSGETRRLPKINIPKWRLIRLEDFRCGLKSPGEGQTTGNLDSDHLWQLFHTIFPRLYSLVWNLPIGPRALLISLIRQKRLRRFESNVVSRPFSRQTTKFVLNTLESLHLEDSQMLQGVAIANLLYFSATFQDDFKFPAGFTFSLLYSLDLTIRDHVKNPCDIQGGDFPVLNVVSLTFLGPSCHFQPLNLPSLTEITISTRSPTFPQPMEFCAFLISQPRNCPQLEQVSLDSFLEWDMLYLLLLRRNLLQDTPVSRIKKLRLRFLPPKFHPTFVSLLAGRQISSPLSLLTLMTRLSIQGTQSRLLDQQVIGCFCCVQLGLADCEEPLHVSRLPEEYCASQTDNGVLSDVIEPLGLFPLYSWDIRGPVIPKFSAYENVWIEGHRKKAEEWRGAVYEWLKLHHRTLVCHRQLCSPTLLVTEFDMERDESQAHTSWLALGSLAEYDELPIRPLIELLQDTDHDVQSKAANAATTLAKLAEHVALHDAIRATIPILVNLLTDGDSYVRSTVASAFAKLAEHVELHDAIRGAIPTLMNSLADRDSYVRLAVASALAMLAEHIEHHGTIRATITALVNLLTDEDSFARSAAASALAKLAEHVELHGTMSGVIPMLMNLLADGDWNLQSAAASTLAKLAEHVEHHDAIRGAIPTLMNLLTNGDWNIRSAAVFSRLAEHMELHDAIRATIPTLVNLLTDGDWHAQSTAASVLAKLAEHMELHDAIRATIPTLMNSLTNQNMQVRSGAVYALARLAEHVGLHDAIRPAIPTLTSLLTDRYQGIRSAAKSALTKLDTRFQAI